MHLRGPHLIYFVGVLTWTEILAEQCYKRCGTQSTTSLSIELRAKEIVLRCNEKTPNYISENDIVSFDAKYLTFDNSLLNVVQMIKQCHKTREKIIKFFFNSKKLNDVLIEKGVLGTDNTIRYFKLERNLTDSKSTTSLPRNFLPHGPHLKTIIVKNMKILDLKDYYFSGLLRVEALDLTSNRIKTVDDNVFKDLISLKSLILKENFISTLSPHTFKWLANMAFLDLSHNKISQVNDKVFSETVNVTTLNLSRNSLEEIDSNAFKALAKLENLDLSGNPRLRLKWTIFSNLTALRSLNLSDCHLGHLPSKFSLPNLNVLNVSGNVISHLERDLFQALVGLRVVDLSNNNIHTLPTTLLQPLKNLQQIYLGFNYLTEFDPDVFNRTNHTINIIDLSSNLINTFSNCINKFKANHIILRNNIISLFPNFLIKSAVGLQSLDLSRNKISSVQLTEEFIPEECRVEIYLFQNKISHIDIPRLGNHKKTERKDNWRIFLYLSQNKLRCNCLKYRIEPYADEEAVVELTSKENICYEQLPYYNCRLTNIENCPKGCDCYYTRIENAIHVNCSSRNLTEYPQVGNMTTDWYQHNQTFVDLKGNFLNVDGQQELENYVNVTSLDLSNNQIEQIKWLPANLMKLKLDNNKLEVLTQDTLKYLENIRRLQKVSLLDNPWVCDCKAKAMKDFLRRYNNIKINDSEVLCRESRDPLVSTDVCGDYFTLKLSSSLTFILAVSSALIALYYKYNTNIKVYIYSKNMCLWFVAEEEVDREKTYDIFISFSNKDERFVQEELLPKLESGADPPFKVCIHHRDWIPGEFISSQIVRSVLDSRRTLVILSNNFMESVWGKMEFRTAHLQAINEGRARVIVVLYGELDEDVLDDEMKTYLRTNTYVKWGDPWFWNKLRYALPHSKISRVRQPEFLPQVGISL